MLFLVNEPNTRQTDRIVYCLKPYSFLTKHKYIQTLIIYNVNVNHDMTKKQIRERRNREKIEEEREKKVVVNYI